MGTNAMRPVLLLLAAATLAACGGSGSGGGGGGGGPVFAGTYRVAAMRGTFDAQPRWASTFGSVSADGVSLAAFDAVLNDEGTVSSHEETVPFVLAPEGTLTLDDGTDDRLRGLLTADARVAILGTFVDGSPSIVMALVRRWEGTASAASVEGVHHFVDLGGGANVVGTLTYDGMGAGVAEGVVLPTSGSLPGVLSAPFTYDVTPEGALVVHFGARSLEGGLVEDGDLSVLAGPTPDGLPATFAAVRAATAASDSTFQGTYVVAGVVHYGASGAPVSWTGAAEADGAGALDFDVVANRTVLVPGTGDATYAVAPDGTLEVAGFFDLRGAISEDGRFAVLCDGDGADPSLFLLVRR